MRSDEAVSPVIGVLLMLTLTLIVAAVVNSFAGGLMDTKEKAPVLTLQCSYSLSDKQILINHVSGDPLPTNGVRVFFQPSRTFGDDNLTNIREIDKILIEDPRYPDLNWANGIHSLKVGETHGIFGDNIEEINPEGIDITDEREIGNSFFLEFYYDRNLIAKSEVFIQP